MDVTSDEIRSSRFQGTRHVYDRREVDAFLHRAAATLEVYERKLAVTQAHVESLEKALDLAHGRARSVRSRETRISELEAALAAAQHNYESAMSLLEAQTEATQVADVADHELVHEARGRAAALLEEAAQEAALIRADSEREAQEAAEAAVLATATAQSEAEELHKRATLEHAAMLDEISQARLDAKEALEAELDTKRSTALAELEAEKVRLAGDTAAAQASLEARVAKAERKAAKADEKFRKRLQVAEERAAAAEAEKATLLAEIERAAAAAEAERKVFMEDAERMFEEAVARAEADREAVSQSAQVERAQADEAEVSQLRRQVAQLRTALAGVQERFRDVSGMSPEELELSAMLVSLEAGGGEVVDLTKPAAPAAAAVDEDSDAADATITVKSRWSEMEPMHAAPRADVGSAPGGDADSATPPAAPTWRDAVGATRENESIGQSETAEEVVIGFYERRLAGLRERLKDAAPREF